MTKKTVVRTIDGIEIEMGSGNVFADLGLPDADKLMIKSGLVIENTKAMRKLGLTQKRPPNAWASLSPRCRPCYAVTSPTFLNAS